MACFRFRFLVGVGGEGSFVEGGSSVVVGIGGEGSSVEEGSSVVVGVGGGRRLSAAEGCDVVVGRGLSSAEIFRLRGGA